MALIALLAAAGPASAQATAYGVKAYSGKITQVLPKPYAGPVSFVVSGQSITGLTVTFGVACQGLGWVRDQDPITTLTVVVRRTGAFSYAGKVGNRHLRLSGVMTRHRVVGTFFQTFWLGRDFCSMSQPALFTASR